MSLSGTVKLNVNLNDLGSPDFDGATLVSPLAYALSQVFADGVGADQINYLWHDRRTLSGSATESIDLANASNTLTNYRGEALNVARVKLLCVHNRSTANTLELRFNDAAAWSTFVDDDGVAILRPEGGMMAWCADATGWAVTAGTGDILVMANGGATDTVYDIIIAGGLT